MDNIDIFIEYLKEDEELKKAIKKYVLDNDSLTFQNILKLEVDKDGKINMFTIKKKSEEA